MTDKIPAQLGAVQETLFIPLAARARETGKRHPLLQDPKAVEMVRAIDFPAEKYRRGVGSELVILRTASFDAWVLSFLDAHPQGTVVEIGTGLNTRFERLDNGTVHWFDLDMPDTIALRRQFFEDTDRRRMLSSSVLDEQWLDEIAAAPGPYFFVAEAVLVYLPPAEVLATLQRIVKRFPDTMIAFDTYSQRTLTMQNRRGTSRGIEARFQWTCDDPQSLAGLQVVESTTIVRPPTRLRHKLPLGYRLVLPALDLLVRLLRRGDMFRITMFRTAA